jgi:hypothetical protein
MTSQRKITANQSNSQRSSGPRTADGKRRASGNSRKHGWAALERLHHPTASPEVEELAKVLCGDEQNPVLLVQARIIAENELLQRAIRLQKFQAIEQRLAEMQRSHKSLEGDECQALEAVAAELDRLERYETRAWSRQMRAIRSFIELSRNS